MTQTEILDESRKLPAREQLEVLQAALLHLQDEMALGRRPLLASDRARKLALAANTLLPDYEGDEELTGFTALDAEEFHAQG